MSMIESPQPRSGLEKAKARTNAGAKPSPGSQRITYSEQSEVVPNTGTALVVEAKKAAQLCGVSRSTWFALKAAGRIPKPVRIGRRTLWRVDELKAWLNAGCPPLHRWEQIAKGQWS